MPGSPPPPAGRYIVHVVDDVDASAAGRGRCEYTSPPHTAAHALELGRALLGYPTPALASDGTWSIPVAGGRRTVAVQPVDRDGQLTLETTSAHV